MLRVLHVIETLPRRGVETLLINLHRNIDRTKIQFDYLCLPRDDNERYEYADEIRKLDGRMYQGVGFFPLSLSRYMKYRKFLNDFFNHHSEYKIVHCHYRTASALELMAARKHGCVTIMHCHNMLSPIKTLRNIAGRGLVYLQRYSADYFFACSRTAGIQQFGSKVDIRFLPNGIDTDRYFFRPEIRRAIRESRGITSDNTLVVGHVGQLYEVKNHKFLVDVFRKIHETVPNSKLWLIGRGELEEDIRAQVHSYGLDDCVDFIGTVGNVNEYLMGMDVFAFPSLREGLSVSLMEAQASGLPCVVSEANTAEGIVSDRVQKFPIINSQDNISRWANSIIQAANVKKHREDYSQKVANAGFDIKKSAKELQDFYLSLV